VSSEAYHQNLKIAQEDFLLRRVVMRSKPTRLGFVLTTRCNLRCIMCERVRVKGDLPDDLPERTRPLYPYLKELHWQGGEVFLVDYFREMFEEAARHPNIDQFIVTAGHLIDRPWAARLAAARARIMFSIDSAVPEVYRVIRRGTEFENVLASLGYLREAEKVSGESTYKTMHTVVMHENMRAIDSLIPFAQEHGIRTIDLTPRLPLDDAPSIFNPKNVPVFRKDLVELRAALSIMRSRAARTGITLADRVTPLIDGLLGPVEPRGPVDPHSKKWDCYVPWHGLFVNAEYNDGDIMPDCMCSATPVGNIAQDDLLETWNNAAMQEYRSRVLEKRAKGWCNTLCTSGEVNPAEWFQWLSRGPHPEQSA
jgi:MoaA/NifB/PqqE/SkfB family radical SAM enzyme